MHSHHRRVPCRAPRSSKFSGSAGGAGEHLASNGAVGYRGHVTSPRRLSAAELSSDYAPAVGAGALTSVLALSAELAPLCVSAGIDTGSVVDIISLDTYNAHRRASRCGRYALHPSDFALAGVATDDLDIRGVVLMPLSLGKFAPTLHLDFYVLVNLALPCDTLIGLPSFRADGIAVHPDRHCNFSRTGICGLLRASAPCVSVGPFSPAFDFAFVGLLGLAGGCSFSGRPSSVVLRQRCCPPAT